MNTNPEAMKKLEIEIKLNINKKLYEKGHITEEMYNKAKQMIISAWHATL